VKRSLRLPGLVGGAVLVTSAACISVVGDFTFVGTGGSATGGATTSSTGTSVTTSSTGGSGTGGATTSATSGPGTGGMTSSSSSGSGAATTSSSTSSSSGATTCGDGKLDPGEQCDDGNRFDLDGCDANCKYEVVDRMTAFALSSSTAPSFCTPATNALGTRALAGLALSNFNSAFQSAIAGGTMNSFIQFLGLTDDTGQSGASFGIGVLGGTLDPAKGTWPGNNPLDWWFLADGAAVSMGLPAGTPLGGTIAASTLTAGPGNVPLALNFGGVPWLFKMVQARMSGTIAGPADVPAPPPGQLQSGLTVFQSITANGSGQGLCGGVTVASLAAVPVPSVLTTGSTACQACTGSATYTACAGNTVDATCNSFLDVLVGGCKVVLCVNAVVNPTQPDMPAGTSVQQLSLGTGNKVPASQIAGNGDAYSAYYTFTANRAHLTGQTCAATSDCQSGKTCNAGICQ
jgi:cysteine-rich repeat protein